jgi:hypothetical protein
LAARAVGQRSKSLSFWNEQHPKKSRKIDVMDTHAVNCAVVAGRSSLKERVLDLNYGLFYGTAFCLAPNLFLTAAHVFQSAQSDGEVTVFRLTPGNFQGVTVQDSEVFANIDLALLHCPGLQAEILPFNFTPLGYLDDVFAMGFPFGLEPPTFHLRAFKGYIVNRRGLTALPDAAPAYELSFVPPPGLSGAPLLRFLSGGSIAVKGMVLQHYTAEFRDRKMELGVALDVEELLAHDSRIVGGSIAEMLFRLQRIDRRQQ